MKTRKSTMKKVLSTAAALMLLTASHAYAGAVSFFDAQVVDVEDFFMPITDLTSPVSIYMDWTNPTAGYTGVWGFDNISFSVGSMTFDQNDIGPGDSAPVAHFTNGVFDGAYLYFDEVVDVFDGYAGAWSPNLAWNYDLFSGDFLGAGTGGEFLILDWDSFAGVRGVTGDPSPVPVPGAVWLLGSGLVGLAQMRRKSNK